VIKTTTSGDLSGNKLTLTAVSLQNHRRKLLRKSTGTLHQQNFRVGKQKNLMNKAHPTFLRNAWCGA